MTPRGRRIFMLVLGAWLVVSPIGWALWQWQSEREARSPSGLATTLSRDSSCADWRGADPDDRRGWARREALRRGWEARIASEQVEERLDGFCGTRLTLPLSAFEAEEMTLQPIADTPGQ